MPTIADLDWKYFATKAGETITMTYWVLAPKHPFDLRSLSAKILRYKLMSQCDTEDQASVGDDDCIGDPDFFNSRFRPIAPVQFALKWSPLPYLSSLLGNPTHCEIFGDRAGCVFAVWPKQAIRPPPSANLCSSRVKKFERRAHEVIAEALDGSEEIGVVVTPGYSYSSRHLPQVVRNALKIHGFKFYTRAP